MAISRSSKQGFKQRPTEWKMKEAEFRLTYKRRDILAVNLIFFVIFQYLLRSFITLFSTLKSDKKYCIERSSSVILFLSVQILEWNKLV